MHVQVINLDGFRFEGTLVLKDDDDTDPASGFSSKLNSTLSLSVDGETMASRVDDQQLTVSAKEEGGGYEVSYRSITTADTEDAYSMRSITA